MGNKLFVGGLSYSTTEDTLRDAFGAFGNVVEAKIISDRETGRSKGYGFVTMETDEAAESAAEQMSGTDLDGRTIKVEVATEGGASKDRAPRQANSKTNKLFIGGLSWDVNDQVLGDEFAKFGNVVSAKVVTDKETGRSKGFGFVEYDSEDAAEAALNEMNGTEIMGRSIRIDFANS